jgi:drug/metabolite transporter (DMT)-like permease
VTPLAFALLLAAALLHAIWNVLLKRSGERYLVTWWALVISAACGLPWLVTGVGGLSGVWWLALASAAVEALYFGVLATAYGSGDFSLVYPVARGAAPAFLAIWAALWLGESPSEFGLLGLALIVGGLMLAGSSALIGSGRRAHGASIALALAVALCISVYSAIDGAAVRSAPAGPYTVLVFALTALMLAPLMLARYGPARLAGELRLRWRTMAVIGLLTIVAYSMVLAAYSIAPVSYGGAIREVSVVFGALIGWRWLREGFGRVRIAGALLIFAGTLAVALGG